ncbi:diguanylate cyclase domain-containing protein [Sphingomonas sp. Tas61C01]|uniref:diguanylate cyclase domain-containing protein n=1 Tax=Sphingomonas sp. Tas61C01 TaxID=3458297 RepID=UPI00403EE4E0
MFDTEEGRRLAALYALDLLDTPPEAEFDAIVTLATHLLGKQAAVLSLIDQGRHWIKARSDTGAIGTSGLRILCDDLIQGQEMTIIEDAAADPRFYTDARLMADGIRFYAGVPLYAPGADGSIQPVGTLCVADPNPGRLDQDSIGALQRLAILAQSLLTARLAARSALDLATLAKRQATDLLRKDQTFSQAETMAKIGSWRYVPATGDIQWSEGVFQIHGLPPGDRAAIDGLLARYPRNLRRLLYRAARASLRTGEPFEIEVDFVDAEGDRRRIRAIGAPEITLDNPVALIGLLQDITDRHRMEERLRRTADRDDLTGIANRAAFDRVLGAAIAQPLCNRAPLMLAVVDLDCFKEVNDTLGHRAGDDVLRAVGRRLREPWLRGSYAARIGGDEFALIVDHPGLLADPAAFVQRLEHELCVPVTAGKITIATSGTVGTATLTDHDNVRDFVHAADTELYAAKRRRIGNRRRTDRHSGPPRRQVAAE